MSFNGVLFEDLRQQLKQLDELLRVPVKSKDTGKALLYQEARVYMFLQCHTRLDDLFKSIYTGSELSKREGSDPKNAPGEVLTWLIKEKMTDKEQATGIVQQYEAASLLAYDSAWLSYAEDKKVYQDFVQHIPRYYYKMNTFVMHFSQRITLHKKEKHAER